MAESRPEVIRLEHFAQLRGFAWRWSHFTPAELADYETGELVVAPAALDWLEELRSANGDVPLVINDATRSKRRQLMKSGRDTGSHVDGMGFDIKCAGEFAEKLERVAIGQGVLGRGIYQSHDRPMEMRFLHVDMWILAPPGLRPRLWSWVGFCEDSQIRRFFPSNSMKLMAAPETIL